ncbi:MAG: UDP-2,3-diacylglucosamine diphosphatase [Thermoanaerobaculia bacterium]
MPPAGWIFVIGDSHIGLAEGDEREIVEWLERLAALAPKALYLNGDVFHYFIGDPKFYTTPVRNFFRKLGELRDRGIEIYYVEGNRDFFVKGSEAEPQVSEVVVRRVIEAGGKRFLIVHGDMINDRDWPYRFWRAVSKNAFMRFAVRLVPKPLARRFVDSVEQKLSKTNFKHKRRLPVELMEAYGCARQEKENVDVVVFGHFHRKLTLPAGNATVEVLPAWFEQGEAMVISPESGEYSYYIV